MILLKRFFFGIFELRFPEHWTILHFCVRKPQVLEFSGGKSSGFQAQEAPEAPEGENDGELGWAVDTAAGGEAGPRSADQQIEWDDLWLNWDRDKYTCVYIWLWINTY